MNENPSSGRSKSWSTWLLGLLAAGGWIYGWNQHQEVVKAGERGEGDGAERSNKWTQRGGEIRDASPAAAMPDAETARLLNQLVEIEAAAVPGQVNEKLLSACRTVMNDPNFRRRTRNYGLLIELMRAEDGPALHEMFLEIHQLGRTFHEYGDFATRWGEIDPQGALAYLSNQDPPRLPPQDLQSVARGWGTVDPEGAMQWFDEHPELASLGGRTAVIEGWIRQDPVAAREWLSNSSLGLTGNELFQGTRAAFLEQIEGPNVDVQNAVEWIAGLPDEDDSMAAFAWRSSQWPLTELPYETAAGVWSQVAGERWIQFDDFTKFCDVAGASRTATTGQAGFLEVLGTHWSSDGIRDRFEEWSAQDPAATSAWLATAPDSEVTRSAIAGMVRYLESADPEAAALWQARLDGR
ncbi:hypothetical protein HNR46_002968 [Haloferula luteola]|uniref:Uncharacterized protein n=1 Tax=Haloferula luteola TaxID=595692 RepID=A0A840VFX2_9BACT|nr:hypothetical protein [Haloferula luteola]MBB5352720.1 hypothetical protein [Haloferula luteola]